MIPVFIPSMSRSAEIAKKGNTVREFPEDTLERLVVVVPPDQVTDYERALDGVGVLACPEKGIAKTRRWIGEYAASQGEEKFLMLDDDLGFLIRRGPGMWQLRGTRPKEVRVLMDMIERLLDTYSCVGISPREGNNRLPADNSVASFVENTRIIRALAFRTGDFLACEHGRTVVMEDFDVLLQLLRMGKPNALLTYFAQGQKQTQAPGGCSDYRTHDNHEASAQKLAELHGGFVRLRQKNNKSGGEFGTRTEVTIQWKKAFESSQTQKENYDGDGSEVTPVGVCAVHGSDRQPAQPGGEAGSGE